MKQYKHSMKRRRRRVSPRVGVMLAAGAGAAVLPGFVLAGPQVAYASTGSIVFTGYGVGSGSGASQFGQIGYASLANLTYPQILAHYYSNTTLASQPDQLISVVLERATGSPAVIYSPSPIDVNGETVPGGTQVKLTVSGGQVTAVEATAATGCAAPPGYQALTSSAGSMTVSPSNLPALGQMVSETTGTALIWCEPGGATETVRGTLQATVNGSGQQVLVNQLGLESYVRGVIANESPASWGLLGGAGPQSENWGFQALEAQAIEVRSYAIANGNQFGFADICDSASCQVYAGMNINLGAPYQQLVDLAQSDTAGQVLKFSSGAVALTQYSASDGGYTAGGAFPAAPDSYDSGCYGNICNPWNPWSPSVTVPISTIEAAYPQVGTVQSIAVTSRNGLGADGGRVLQLQIAGSSGQVAVSGSSFAEALGLPSDWFVMSGPIAIANGETATSSPSTGQGGGFILASSDGGTAAGGGAADLGSTYTYGITGLSGSRPLAAPIVGVAANPSGAGYWLVAADGGIFNFGDAGFYGNPYTYGITGLSGSRPLAAPIVGMAATPDGRGYWLVAADGGIFNFGDAGFYGNPYTLGYSGLSGSNPLSSPIVGMAATPDGRGYWLLEKNGTVLAFGDAVFYGSAGQLGAPAVGIIRPPSGGGYSVVLSNGELIGFGAGLSSPALSSSTTGHGAPIAGGAAF